MIELHAPAYWDTNLFLAYIEGTIGQIEAVDDLIAHLALGSAPGIVTSVISIVEVAFLEDEKRRRRLDPSLDVLFDALWSDPVIRLVELNAQIAADARRLVRASLLRGPRLKPPDAIHLATARHAGVRVFLTRDATLIRHSDRHGLRIAVP